MNTDKVLLRDLFNIVNAYRVRIALICVLTMAFFFQLTFWIEKQYVSSFEINVYSKYFQSPLISSVIPDMFNVPEMRFAIDSMVKEAISDEYVDQIGRRYKIYSATKDEREMARERQFLRDRFSYFSTGGQSYQITFSHKDPYIAKQVAQDTLKVVNDHMINKRISTIELAREVMVRRLNSFNAAQKANTRGADNALASRSPEVLKEELVKLNSDISALKMQFKENHPKVRNMIQRRDTIVSWLKDYDLSDLNSKVTDSPVPVAISQDKAVSEQLASKFYAKYHDFNIALEIEKRSIQTYIGVIKRPQLPTAPMWPKKRLFASLGLIVGLILAFIYVFMSEVIVPGRREKLQMEANSLGVMVLGELPMKLDPAALDKKTPLLKKAELVSRGYA